MITSKAKTEPGADPGSPHDEKISVLGLESGPQFPLPTGKVLTPSLHETFPDEDEGLLPRKPG